MKKLLLAVFIMTTVGLFGLDADSVIGKWLTDGGKSVIEISKDKDVYAGKMIWLKIPVYPEDDKNAGKEKMDINNPDEKLRNKKLNGITLLWGFKFKKGKWVGGRIYDPENGKTYFCKIKMDKNNNLVIKGSLDKWGLVGRSTVWTHIRKEDEKFYQ